jgi:hypothetical protein
MMDIIDKTNAIQFIRPNSIFTLRGDEIDWIDSEQTKPTAKEIADGLVAFNAAQEAKESSEMAAKAAVLQRLGISEDEANLLLK